MKRLSLLICILSLGAANAFASVTGSIVGTVTDATGGMNTGATVTAR
jgi:L-aminopeptidase/D-esterase-like protein